MKTPRGIRKKNPMNIRRTADHWVGMAEVQHDSSFVEFTAFKYGYRAAFIILHRYMNTYSIKTLSAVIRMWCPAGDGKNNPEHYAQTVCKLTGMAIDELLSFENRPQMMNLAIGMTYVECGKDFDIDKLCRAMDEGYDLALKKLGYKM